jgi:predicted DNA-binding transcriptional regulator YafY
MKSERLVSIMLLLQARSPRSARELAQALEVSMRTVYRDVEALGASGVPVYAERGSGGGIILSDGYRQAIAQFSTDELHALFVAAADPLADLGVAAHERALHKIKGALPDLQRRAAEKAGERILLDHNRWYRSEQPAGILATLRRAVWDDRAVRVTYSDRNGTTTTRDIEPLGLISKAGIWYVAARIDNGEMRMNFTEKPVTPYEATLRIDREATEMVSYFRCETIAEDERTRTLRVQFSCEDAAVGHVMLLGNKARVLGPAQLREAVIKRAQEMISVLELDTDGLTASTLTRENQVIGHEVLGSPKHDE